MDAPSFENLRSFFDRVKNAGFFERLFSWKTIVSSGFDAFGEYQRLQNLMQEKDQQVGELIAKNRELSSTLEYQGQQIRDLQRAVDSERTQGIALNEKIADKERDRAKLTETVAQNDREILRLKEELVAFKVQNEELARNINDKENVAGGLVAGEKKNREMIEQLKADLATSSAKYDLLNSQFTEAQKNIAAYQQKEAEQQKQFDLRIERLNSLQEQMENEQRRINEEREAQIHQEYEKIEQAWQKHEEMVELTIRNICRKVNLTYCSKDEFPFAGKPDNSIVICDQYIIFDAKSPENSEKLENFPAYIKSEAQKVKKYVDGENVKKEIFLVVPADTVYCLKEFVYPVGDGVTVYVVTHDCIEPIILALKKVEDYEFIDRLSPEDRENISQVIGKFVHTTKRRLQIDTFFCDKNLELLDSSTTLPENIQDKLVEIERSEVLNPPTEQRKKTIDVRVLEKKVKLIKKDAESRGIDVGVITQATLDTIPLQKSDE